MKHLRLFKRILQDVQKHCPFAFARTVKDPYLKYFTNIPLIDLSQYSQVAHNSLQKAMKSTPALENENLLRVTKYPNHRK